MAYMMIKMFGLTMLTFLLLLQYRLWFGKNSWPDYLVLKQEITTQPLANNALKNKNTLRYREIDDLQSGLAAIEERARNELGLIKEDEVFFRIIE